MQEQQSSSKSEALQEPPRHLVFAFSLMRPLPMAGACGESFAKEWAEVKADFEGDGPVSFAY